MNNNSLSGVYVPEDMSRLCVVDGGLGGIDLPLITEQLQQDNVVVVPGLSAEDADTLMFRVVEQYGLSDTLEVQAGFASVKGHRHNLGKYYMSVNNRSDYQFIPPHSEGTSFSHMQLASFYCLENSTDGGETLLLNVDQSCDAWGQLREKRVRAKVGDTQLSRKDIVKARMQYRLRLPDDVLSADDKIIVEKTCDIAGLQLYDALVKIQQAYSCIAQREVYTYWDSVGSIDADSAEFYLTLLEQAGLLKIPPTGKDIQQLDNAAPRRVWHSGIELEQLFKCKLTRKLQPGDVVLVNNMTWAHSVSNWTPGSGRRRVAAAFA